MRPPEKQEEREEEQRQQDEQELLGLREIVAQVVLAAHQARDLKRTAASCLGRCVPIQLQMLVLSPAC